MDRRGFASTSLHWIAARVRATTHTVNFKKALLPTGENLKHVFLDRLYEPFERLTRWEGKNIPTLHVDVTANIIQVDEALATVVLVAVDQ